MIKPLKEYRQIEYFVACYSREEGWFDIPAYTIEQAEKAASDAVGNKNITVIAIYKGELVRIAKDED